jgi:hypothetical protein
VVRSAIMTAVAALVSATCAQAQTYPARPINVIVSLAAGTGMAIAEKEKVETIGLIPHETPSIEGMGRYIRAETEKWGALVRSLGLEGSE